MQISRLSKTSVKAVAPTRVDLAGGTLDLWPIHHLLNQKATVNVGISLNAQTVCSLSKNFSVKSNDLNLSQQGSFEELINNTKIPIIGLLLKTLWHEDLPPIAIETQADSPAGAGIGGSSSLGITIAAALNAMKNLMELESLIDHDRLVRTVQDVESKLIRSPTGIQDYWGAVRGNLNIIEFLYGETKVQTINSTILSDLDEKLIIVYSGQSRSSAFNNWEIFKKLYDGDDVLLEKFNEIGTLAYQCAHSLRQGNLEKALEFSETEWCLRKNLWPTIETPMTQKIDSIALKSGAYFSRVCGAGGGGIVAIFSPKEKCQKIRDTLDSCGFRVLDASVAFYGLKIQT